MQDREPPNEPQEPLSPEQSTGVREEVANLPLDLPASLLPETPGPRAETEPSRAPDGPKPLWERALRQFVDTNWRMSTKVSHWAEAKGRRDGWYEHPARLSAMLRPGMTVVDLGSGRTPAIPLEDKRRLGLHVIGVDISAEELEAAAEGGYDEIICTDAESFSRPGVADLVISRALAEHLRHPERMFQRTWELLKEGGETLHFIPNRHALFAHLNRMIPEGMKRKLLNTLYPLARNHLGFEAFYNSCTPAAVRSILEGIGFQEVTVDAYYSSNYFVALLPAHMAMVGWQLTAMNLGAAELCENFIVYGRKDRP